MFPRRQRYLTAVAAAHARTPHPDATTAKRQLALGVASARGLASAVVLVAAAAQARTVLFEHRGQHAHAGVHHPLVQRGAGLEYRRQRELPDVRRPLASILLPGSVLHRRFLSGKHPDHPIGAGGTATFNFQQSEGPRHEGAGGVRPSSVSQLRRSTRISAGLLMSYGSHSSAASSSGARAIASSATGLLSLRDVIGGP